MRDDIHACLAQNHRMFGVGRDLWGSSDPTPQIPRVCVIQLSSLEIFKTRVDEVLYNLL